MARTRKNISSCVCSRSGCIVLRFSHTTRALFSLSSRNFQPQSFLVDPPLVVLRFRSVLPSHRADLRPFFAFLSLPSFLIVFLPLLSPRGPAPFGRTSWSACAFTTRASHQDYQLDLYLETPTPSPS